MNSIKKTFLSSQIQEQKEKNESKNSPKASEEENNSPQVILIYFYVNPFPS